MEKRFESYEQSPINQVATPVNCPSSFNQQPFSVESFNARELLDEQSQRPISIMQPTPLNEESQSTLASATINQREISADNVSMLTENVGEEDSVNNAENNSLQPPVERLKNESGDEDKQDGTKTHYLKNGNLSIGQSLTDTEKKHKSVRLDCVLLSIEQKLKQKSTLGKQQPSTEGMKRRSQDLTDDIHRAAKCIGIDEDHVADINPDVIRRNIAILNRIMKSLPHENRPKNKLESLNKPSHLEEEVKAKESSGGTGKPPMLSRKESHSSYTFEFKLGAVKRVLEGGESRHGVARSLGIDDSLVRRWCKDKVAIEHMNKLGAKNATRRSGSGRKVASRKLDSLVLEWLLENKANNIHVSQSKIGEKAHEIYWEDPEIQADILRYQMQGKKKVAHIDGSTSQIESDNIDKSPQGRPFAASKGWVNAFLRRYSSILKDQKSTEDPDEADLEETKKEETGEYEVMENEEDLEDTDVEGEKALL